MSNYLAVDLGAESGRVILGSLAGGRLALEEVRRFPNQPVQLPSGLYWDSFRLFHEIEEGLTDRRPRAAGAGGGIGVDTWGVDFGLLAADGGLIDCPRHYRDPRTNGVPERLFEKVSRWDVFAPNRHPDHAHQHAVPVVQHAAGGFGVAARCGAAALHAGLAELLADGRPDATK